MAINNIGQVIGGSLTDTGGSVNDHAFVYHTGEMTALGTLPGDARSGADAINNKGEIVGGSETSYTARRFHGSRFLYANRKLTVLKGLPHVMGINDRGEMIGTMSMTTGRGHAFMFASGKLTDLGKSLGPNFSAADALNNIGEIVGRADMPAGSQRAVLYRSGKVEDLGVLAGDTDSSASAINNKGQIVGTSAGTRRTLVGTRITGFGHIVFGQANVEHAVLFDLGRSNPTALGTLPGDTDGRAKAINIHGQIVGQNYTFDGHFESGNDRAVLYQAGNTTPIDLNTCIPKADQVKWRLEEATGINDSGQICGNGIINGQKHAFLLTPRN